MKLFWGFSFSLISIFANAAITNGKVYFVHIDSAKYQLASGKTITAEMDIGFFTEADAELANKNLPKVKKAVEQAMAETNTDTTTKKGKFVLAAEAASKIQDSGFKAQTVLWNSFMF